MKQAEHAPAVQRHVIAMKPVTSPGYAIGLLLGVVIVSVSCFAPEPGGSPPFRAAIHADCAPWDGSAFIVSIPVGSGGSIDISIWQAPDLLRPMTFSFPDPTGRTGTAVYRTAAGDNQMLRGTVSFVRVETGRPVEGSFVLAADRGMKFRGQFEATWGNTATMCG
jgi:hypothetical protein